MPDETRGRMHPTGQLRMLMDPAYGRIQYEWADASGNAEWRDIPLVKVDRLPPSDEEFFMLTGPK